MKWRTDVLPRRTSDALEFFASQEWLSSSQWYLAGGTALALQVGHRSSEDLDFFTPEKSLSPSNIIERLPDEAWKARTIDQGTIFGEYNSAKVSFIAYPFFVPREKKLQYGHVNVLSTRDIAVMKIIAISQRGKKRDFLDLYWYATHVEPIGEVIARVPDQYPTVTHDYHHILKALIYFDDAENDPMPELHFQAKWDEIKAYFKNEIPKVTKELLGLKD